jgi:hypothetical protein
MFKRILLITTLFTVITTNVSGQNSGFGAGIMLGEPTGISLKNWISGTNAWDAGIAWGFGKNGAFHLHGDYLWHEYGLIEVDKGALPLYYGVGARVLFASDTHLGIRGVIGLDYQFEGVPLDVFLELAPIFDLVPGTKFSFNGALGVRYFF